MSAHSILGSIRLSNIYFLIGEQKAKDYEGPCDKTPYNDVRAHPPTRYCQSTTLAARYTGLAPMARQAVVILFTVLAFGILVPWYKGFTFLDPRILLAYALLALLFVAPASAESAAAHAKSTAGVLSRTGMVVAYGWGVSVVMLITALVTVNLTNWRGSLMAPPAAFLSAVLVFSLTASFAVAILSGVLARRFSATGIKSILRFGFLGLLLAMALSNRFLPERWQIILSDYSTRRALTRVAWEGAAICAGLAIALLIPLLRKVHKANV